MASARAMLERRRASRVQIQIPVKVVSSETGVEPQGTPAEVLSVSRTGALLRVPFLPPLGSRIEIKHSVSHEVREFRVISVKNPAKDQNNKQQGPFELGVEILYPTRNFWGIQFPDEQYSA